MTWWAWILITIGVILLLFIFRLVITYTVIQSVEESYSLIIPKYYFDADLYALEDAMKTQDRDSQLQYNILKLTAANPEFLEALDALCEQYNYIAEINQKFSDRTAEIILTPKTLINAEGNEEA